MSSKLKLAIQHAIKTILLVILIATSALCHAKGGNEFVLIIDPGHGGKDYGAIGKITNEKTINLAVAKLVGKMIQENFDDVKVVYTREIDTFVSLKERADIANKANGNLFISIHVNSVARKSKNRTTVKGASVYTLGLHKSASNLEVAKRENAVITLESDYSAKYQGFDPESTESYIVFEMSQNKHMEQSVAFAQEIENELIENAGRADKGVRQAGFWVLWATGMPSVLVELDFICNPTQEKFMASDEGREKMATSIFNAFKRYKANYDKSIKTPITEQKATDKTTDKVDAPKSQPQKNKAKKRRGKQSAKLSTGKTTDKATQQPEKQTPAKEPVTLKDTAKIDSNAITPSQNAKTKTDSLPRQEDKIIYKIQFLTSNKLIEKGDKAFKGLYPVGHYKAGGLWKYTFGETPSKKDAEKQLRKIKDKFPDAFIIATRNGKRL